ncbi:CIC11C00000003791 [Sungouiella intermedia]|uniref:Maintenance of mitochondrial morphology protein 1 n=1 Tax=Sungouiella intermedia TaxID=45354 RepID=A0A1L0FZQ3_9ASCO|nr:CIC11C00000003791 [[Candida] intermedia]
MSESQDTWLPERVERQVEIIQVPVNTLWSFAQGLIFGQVISMVVLFMFLKFFVFSESSPSTGKRKKREASGVVVNRQKKENGEANDDEDSSILAAILEKTYYDVDNHTPESLDWFNVLVAQTISQFRSEALLSDNIYHSLNEVLSKLELPDFLDKIELTEIDIGDDFPIFSNCRIKHSADGTGRLEAKIDVDLSDTLTLGIDTRLLLNQPRPFTAALPVQLSVSLVRFSGCLTVSLANNDPSKNPKLEDQGGTALMFSFSPDYRLEFSVKSLIGSRAKLQDIPKISELIESKLRSWFTDRCIEPKFQVIKLPSMWPRSKNTREPKAEKPESLKV